MTPVPRRTRAIATQLIGATLTLLVAGCYPVNPRLARVDLHDGYRYKLLAESPKNTQRTLIVLTFSGGGTRAAAFAYGVLEELRATSIADDRTMLDEVDVMSSVSGGSFAAAYYGVFGRDRFFDRFASDVLYRKIERDLALRVVAPWNWPKLLSPSYSRSDLTDDYYDANIFEHHVFADIRARPYVVLNATDIGRGAQFSFTQEHFDRLCSDVSQVPISRAVTASSAFPVAFAPLTLKNYGARACGYVPPLWVVNAGDDLDLNPQLYDLARTWRSYEDETQRSYIHLSDGGIADNIGLRAIEPALMGLAQADETGWTPSLDILAMVNERELERLVVIAVDAKPESESCDDRRAHPPGIATVLNAAASNPMENYSSDTVERFRLSFGEWDDDARNFEMRRNGCDVLAHDLCRKMPHWRMCEETRRDQCYARVNATDMFRPPHPELTLIHVRFESIPDAAAQQRLKGIQTRLQLSKEEVDSLIYWARRLLRESKTYGELVEKLRAP